MGEKKLMTDLAVGDKVAVSTNGKDITYEEIYAFGHKDSEATADYVQLKMKDGDDQANSLELSGLHFVPTISSEGEVVFKRAQDIEVGETVMATNASLGQASPHTVTDILALKKQGQYNPYTMGGTIIVNGVVASAHSEWFLDGIFDALGCTHWLPAAYQAVLSPARFLYAMLGKETYAALYKSLDARVDIAKSGTEYGGGIIASAALIGMLGFYGLANMNRAKSE